MNKYGCFDRRAKDTDDLKATYRGALAEGGGSILLEGGAFVIDRKDFPNLNPSVELYLGDGTWLEVWDGLEPDVRLTLPEEYVEALDQVPQTPRRSRRLYWSSPTPPHGLDDPSQNPYGYGDVTLYVPESLEPLYREKGFSEPGTPSRRYLEIWEDYELPPSRSESLSAAGPGEAVKSPDHYTWLGQSLAALGLSDAADVESWDVLDAAFPSDPLLWNCGKYLLRQGRKGGEEERLEDLRKARQYLDRQIARLSQGGGDLDH
nr:MAG TPA: nucelotide kinase [Caudoviricetes sp.]